MDEIKIACGPGPTVDIDLLNELQGDLKSLSTERYQQLRNEIIKTGFAFPIHVWKDSDDHLWIVGGHQRKRTLEAMRKEGISIPPVPTILVEAEDINGAKDRVLQDITQYGKVERQGLYEFMVEASIDPGEMAERFSVPDIDMPTFNAEYFMDHAGTESESSGKVGAKEYGESEFSNFNHECPRCGFHFNAGESKRDPA